MAGLVPAIHDLWCGKDVDARVKPGHDGGESLAAQAFKNSDALYSERNGRLAAPKVSSAPSSRSTMVSTSTTSAPVSRTASTAFIAEPPVVVTSSTITTRLPSRVSPLG